MHIGEIKRLYDRTLEVGRGLERAHHTMVRWTTSWKKRKSSAIYIFWFCSLTPSKCRFIAFVTRVISVLRYLHYKFHGNSDFEYTYISVLSPPLLFGKWSKALPYSLNELIIRTDYRSWRVKDPDRSPSFDTDQSRRPQRTDQQNHHEQSARTTLRWWPLCHGVPVNASASEKQDYVEYCLAAYREQPQSREGTPSEYYADKFRFFTVADLRDMKADSRQRLRDLLRAGDDYVPKGRNVLISNSLFKILRKDIPWPKLGPMGPNEERIETSAVPPVCIAREDIKKHQEKPFTNHVNIENLLKAYRND